MKRRSRKQIGNKNENYTENQKTAEISGNMIRKEYFQSLTLTSHTEGKREAWEVADLARFL